MQVPLMRRYGFGALMTGTLLLSACGGGGSSGGPVDAPLTLRGTAAVSGTMANATVTAKCQGGQGAAGQATTASDGSYSLQLSGANLPCVLRVNDGKGRLLHSVAQDAGRSTVANITPLTELLLTRAAKLDAAKVYEGYSDKLAAGLSTTALSTAQGEVVGLLNGTVDASTAGDFIRAPIEGFVPGKPPSKPLEEVLDKFAQRVSADRYAEWLKMLASDRPMPDPGPFKPELRLLPATLYTTPGQTVSLSAELNYPPNVRYARPPLVWTVLDADGGKLGSDGATATTYTAPTKKGSYRLKAQRDDFANVSATQTVIVGDFVPTLDVAERQLSLMPGQSYQFSASINYPPDVVYVRQPTTWTLLEAGGGSISIEGHYTAPAQPGTYHAQVRRDDYPEKLHTVEIKVGTYQSLDRLAGPLQYLGLPPERTVIRDAASWAAWKRDHGVQTPPHPNDEVDFSKHMVVAIVWPRLDPCSRVSVLALAPVGNSLQANIQILPPLPNVICAAVVWNPVWLLATPQSELPLVVVEQ